MRQKTLKNSKETKRVCAVNWSGTPQADDDSLHVPFALGISNPLGLACIDIARSSFYVHGSRVKWAAGALCLCAYSDLWHCLLLRWVPICKLL